MRKDRPVMNYTSSSQRLNLTIEGMSCGYCV